MKTIAAIVSCVAFASLAPACDAHDKWADGSEVPSWVKAACCGPRDVHQLSSDDYWIDSDGFHLKAIDAVKALSDVLPSQDGRVWAFYNDDLGRGATLYCVFYSGSI